MWKRDMRRKNRRKLGLFRLLRRLGNGRATLADRAWTVSPAAWPLSRFLTVLRARFITMRRASIDIALNTARLQAQAQSCREMAGEQASQAGHLAASGDRIADLSDQTATAVGEIAGTFDSQVRVAHETLAQLTDLHESVRTSGRAHCRTQVT